MAAPAAAQHPPLVLSAAIWAAAEAGDAAAVERLLDSEGYASPDCRSLNQSTLLHCAAKRGHVQLAARLLGRGADVNSLDYGGMRRTPLHWACKGGHVRMVELLVDSGADTKNGRLQANGRSWSKLVQGSRCGSLIPKDSPTESVESVCRTNLVRLALTQPRWGPGIHHMWPAGFKQAAKLLLMACCVAPHGGCGSSGGVPAAASGDAVSRGDAGSSGSRVTGTAGGSEEQAGAAAPFAGSGSEEQAGAAAPFAGSGDGGGAGGRLPLSRDMLLEVLRRAAYPISAWV